LILIRDRLIFKQNLPLRAPFHIMIFFLICLPLLVSAKNEDNINRKKLDSLMTVAKSQGLSFADYDISREISDQYMVLLKGDSAFYWGVKSLEIARKEQSVQNEIDAFQQLGTIHETVFKKYKPALEYYTAGAELAGRHQLVESLHEVYTNILNLCFYLADFATAMRYATNGLNLAEKTGEKKRIAHYESLIGFIHLRQSNPVAAEKYYRSYLSYAVSVKDTLTIADVYTSLAECDMATGKFNSALNYMKQSLAMYQDLHAKKRLSKVDRIPYTLFKIGYCLGVQERTDSAMKYVLQSLYYAKIYPCNLYDVAQYKIYAGNLYLRQGMRKDAARMLHEGLQLAIDIDHKENIRDAFFYLQQLFAKHKQYDSAYHYNILFTRLKDSIANEITTREIEQIETTYALEKKDNQIKLLEQEKKLQEARTKRQLLWRNLLIVITVMIMILIVFLLNRNYLRRKNRLQQEINARQNEIFNISASVQDHERKRIAKDLHDGMGTLLSAAKLKLSALQDQRVGDTINLLDDAIAELRNISHNLMPATLSKLGLVAALENLFSKIRNLANLEINLVVHGFTGRIPEEKEMILYRIVLELVNNVVKHANATALTVQLIKYPGEIMLTVEDNGSGFSENALYKTGIGLSNIRSRIAYLEGSMRIDTNQDAGTTVIVDVPV
jgi:two-component system NarL family sensor kinase